MLVSLIESYCLLLYSARKLCSGHGIAILGLCYSYNEDSVYKSEDTLRINVCSVLSKERYWRRCLVLPKWLT